MRRFEARASRRGRRTLRVPGTPSRYLGPKANDGVANPGDTSPAWMRTAMSIAVYAVRVVVSGVSTIPSTLRPPSSSTRPHIDDRPAERPAASGAFDPPLDRAVEHAPHEPIAQRSP